MTKPATPMALREDEAHVWYCRTASGDTPALLAYYRSLLNGDETDRLERLAFDHLKLEYLMTRALCRTVLSTYANDMPPWRWRFHANGCGRPEIDAGGAKPPLRFNLSNARSLVACVVTRTADSGIDVEMTSRSGEIEGIADSHFSPSEHKALRALPPKQQRERCLDLWTLKESYIKARGIGLSIQLDQFSFELPDRPIRISFDPRVGDRASDWQFALLNIEPQHQMALAIRHATRPPFRIQVREVVPGPAPPPPEGYLDAKRSRYEFRSEALRSKRMPCPSFS